MIMATTAVQAVEKNITSVALADIQPSNYNPRKNFDETSLAELAESIRQQGVLQPIGVRPIADNRFEIVFGERRYRASLMAELAEIPAIVMEISDETAEEMAEQDEITISVASEICRYGEEIQREVYDQHLKEGVQYNSWRGMKASEVAQSIERQYTADLNRYSFDKTLCLSCPHNTNNMMLFCEGGCGNCANRACLVEMNTSHLTEKAMRLMEQHPAVPLCHESYNYNEAVIDRLTAMGYEVESLKTYATKYPESPQAPQKEDYDTTEEYEDAEKDYGQELNGYTEKCEAIRTRSEAGEISLYLRIESNDITLCYVANTATTVNGTATEMPLSPIEKLEKQDKRNKEIALEKTVEDTKKRILEVDMSERKFGQDEEKMVYFFLLSSLRKEHFNEVGIEDKGSYYYLTSEDKMRIIENLTAKQKAVIRRDYLIANFKDAFGNNATASLLLGFAQKHMPEELANIQDGYNEVYEKRHQRIKEKKAALQEQATQEAEQPDEPQPEAEAQTEPQTEEICSGQRTQVPLLTF